MDEFVCGTNMPLVRAQCRIDYLEKQLETYAKPVEMTQEQYVEFDNAKNNASLYFYMAMGQDWAWHFSSEMKQVFSEEDLMRAWLHPDLIVIKE